jgi:hypothetical protein
MPSLDDAEKYGTGQRSPMPLEKGLGIGKVCECASITTCTRPFAGMP